MLITIDDKVFKDYLNQRASIEPNIRFAEIAMEALNIATCEPIPKDTSEEIRNCMNCSDKTCDKRNNSFDTCGFWKHWQTLEFDKLLLSYCKLCKQKEENPKIPCKMVDKCVEHHYFKLAWDIAMKTSEKQIAELNEIIEDVDLELCIPENMGEEAKLFEKAAGVVCLLLLTQQELKDRKEKI